MPSRGTTFCCDDRITVLALLHHGWEVGSCHFFQLIYLQNLCYQDFTNSIACYAVLKFLYIIAGRLGMGWWDSITQMGGRVALLDFNSGSDHKMAADSITIYCQNYDHL